MTTSVLVIRTRLISAWVTGAEAWWSRGLLRGCCSLRGGDCSGAICSLASAASSGSGIDSGAEGAVGAEMDRTKGGGLDSIWVLGDGL